MPASEFEPNRSDTLTPAQHGMLNSAIEEAVTASVKAMIAGMMPTLQAMNLDTAKTIAQAMNAPKQKTDDEIAAAARESRERKKSQADSKAALETQERLKASCLHRYSNNVVSVSLVHNQLDHRPRGVCMVCHSWIHPTEWRILPGTDEFPEGKAVQVPAHKDYSLVLQLENARQS